MFKKPHIPLVSRTANYSCSLTSRSPRRRIASTQTERHLPVFESNPVLREDLVFDEETTKTYSVALEYVNTIHYYMNKKLSEKYGECGDTKPEGDIFFKLPEVPNYAAVFFMLLEKTKGSKLATGNGNALKKKVNSLKPELQPKRYTTKGNSIEFVPDLKKLSKPVEPNDEGQDSRKAEQEVQTVLSYQLDNDSISFATKTISEELSPFCSNKSSNCRTSSSEGDALKKGKADEANIVVNAKKTSQAIINNEEADKGKEIKQQTFFFSENVYKKN